MKLQKEMPISFTFIVCAFDCGFIMVIIRSLLIFCHTKICVNIFMTNRVLLCLTIVFNCPRILTASSVKNSSNRYYFIVCWFSSITLIELGHPHRSINSYMRPLIVYKSGMCHAGANLCLQDPSIQTISHASDFSSAHPESSFVLFGALLDTTMTEYIKCLERILWLSNILTPSKCPCSRLYVKLEYPEILVEQ